MAKLEKLTDDQIEAHVRNAVMEAVAFIQRDIAPSRLKAQEYFDGKVDIGETKGRSKVVATKVRDTIRQIRPSLMRIFLSHENPVEFVAANPQDAAWVEQATRYISQLFERQNGFLTLFSAFDDSLRKKVGYVMVVTEKAEKTQIYTYTGLTEEEMTMIVSDENVKVIEHSEEQEQAVDPQTGQPVSITLHDIKIARTCDDTQVRMIPIAPENFFIDADAISIDGAFVCGHTEDKRVADLLADGYKLDDVVDLDCFQDETAEDAERKDRPINKDQAKDSIDPTMKLVSVTEAFMRVDVDGTGKPVLHRFILGGTKYKLLEKEPIDAVEIIDFQHDPEPHAHHGHSIFDLIKNEQDASTAVLRGILDNVAMVNNPRTAVVDSMVNMGDVLNNEIGAVVRMRQPGMVAPLETPFTAGQTLPALQYLDDLTEQKTGVTRASQGLDPDALQSTTKAAVTATIQAAAGQVETMARHLANGMARLFMALLRATIKNSQREHFIEIGRGQFQPVDVRVWNADCLVRVNVGLGTGREEERQQALMFIIGKQEQVLFQIGPQNGFVTLQHYRNALADLAATSGIRTIDRYFAQITPQVEQAVGQAMQAAAGAGGQQQPDPTQGIVAGEQIKAQAKLAADSGKLQLEREKMLMQDDRERDKMAQDLFLGTAKIEQDTHTKMNTAALKAAQAAPRPGAGPEGAA